MKTRNLLFAAFVAAMAMAACESVLPEQQPPIDEPRTFTVHLGMSGEINVSQNPLTRFTPDDRDLYGIQVYHKPASKNTYTPCAYGLFDNIEDVKLEVTENYNYAIEVILVNDGKDMIHRDSILVDDVPYIGYDEPFYAYNRYPGAKEQSVTIVSNEFTYAEDRYFYNYYDHERDLRFSPVYASDSDFINPRIDTYYGKLVDYTPTTEGAVIDIYMKHMIYGLKVEVGEFFNEGKLEVFLYAAEFNKGYPDTSYDTYTLTPDNKSKEYIYTHYEVGKWYNQTDVTKANCSRDIDFTWTKADGTKVNWQRESILFTRLKETVVTLDYYEDESAGSNNISMHYDDTEMELGYKSYVIGDTQDEYDW